MERHSGSATAYVRVACDGSAVRVDVVDEGHGMPSEADGRGPTGNGIPCMRERVAQLGGTIEIVSGLSGTVVRAMVPIRPAR